MNWHVERPVFHRPTSTFREQRGAHYSVLYAIVRSHVSEHAQITLGRNVGRWGYDRQEPVV